MKRNKSAIIRKKKLEKKYYAYLKAYGDVLELFESFIPSKSALEEAFKDVKANNE